MDILQKYFEYFQIHHRSGVLHVVGEDGVGKTTLILEIIQSYLEQNLDARVFLLDSEKKFTKKRLRPLRSMSDRIYHQNLRSGDQLYQNLQNLQNPKNPYTVTDIPMGSLLIIHSFSALMREDLAQVQDYLGYLRVITTMNSSILPQLISLAVKNRWHLILTHHVAFDPEFKENRPAFHSLLENVNGMWWFLQKIPVEKSKISKEITYLKELRIFARFNLEMKDTENIRFNKIFRAKISFKSES